MNDMTPDGQSEGKQIFSIRLPVELISAIDRWAAHDRRSRTNMIQVLIEIGMQCSIDESIVEDTKDA
jgi:hypothetical protein